MIIYTEIHSYVLVPHSTVFLTELATTKQLTVKEKRKHYEPKVKKESEKKNYQRWSTPQKIPAPKPPLSQS